MTGQSFLIFGCSDMGELIRDGTEAPTEKLELAPGLFIG
jgi:hypothetical protein